MTPIRCTLSLLLAASLASACDNSSGTKDAASTKADAKQAKAGDVKTETKADAKDPHAAANPHAADPHAAANPHAGMPPMMGAPSAPKGPPRDIKPSGQTIAETLLGLSLSVPSEWEKGTPTNSMRVAQWVLPGPGGDAELVVFRFPGGGGGIEENVKRWKEQFQAPEGKSIDDVTKTKTVEVGGLKTTIVDVSGTYVAAVTPGADEKHNDANQRMLAAIVEGSGDPFYFKAVGPQATMDLWAGAFEAMANGFAAAGGAAAATGGAATAVGGEVKAAAGADAKAGGEGKADAAKKAGEGKADEAKDAKKDAGKEKKADEAKKAGESKKAGEGKKAGG